MAAPFLARIAAIADIRLLMLLSLTIAAIDSKLGSGRATFLTSFIPYVGYFFAGHYLAPYAPRPRPGLLGLLALLCGGAIALGTGALLPTLGAKSWGVMYAYLNPLVIVMSLCVFLSLASAPETALSRHVIVQSLSRISLGIYVIHPIWLWVLGRSGVHGLALHPAIAIPLTTLAAFALSAISAAVLAQLPWLRSTGQPGTSTDAGEWQQLYAAADCAVANEVALAPACSARSLSSTSSGAHDNAMLEHIRR